MENLESWRVPAGTVVQVNGIPFYLADDTRILGTTANMILIQPEGYRGPLGPPAAVDES
jgi:hypothetical protein